MQFSITKITHPLLEYEKIIFILYIHDIGIVRSVRFSQQPGMFVCLISRNIFLEIDDHISGFIEILFLVTASEILKISRRVLGVFLWLFSE